MYPSLCSSFFHNVDYKEKYFSFSVVPMWNHPHSIVLFPETYCSRVVCFSFKALHFSHLQQKLLMCSTLHTCPELVCALYHSCCQVTNVLSFLFCVRALPPSASARTHAAKQIQACALTHMPTHSESTEGGKKNKKKEKISVLSHKRLFVWASASLPKLDHSVFDGTRCMSIKETEELTAGQIRALNLSICLDAARSRAGEGVSGGDYRDEISERETGCLYEVGRQKGSRQRLEYWTEAQWKSSAVCWRGREGRANRRRNKSQRAILFFFFFHMPLVSYPAAHWTLWHCWPGH